MNSGVVILLSLSYLIVLFAVAYWAERQSKKGKSPIANPYVYALSMAVYCTAWTFYGSVGRTITNGLEFLAVYIGPTLAAPLWMTVLRKIIRICKVQRISTIADFISTRYGKNISLGMLVSLFCIVGIIPYIALQLKAIASSFAILTSADTNSSFMGDLVLYIAIGLGVFTILFGTRNIEATERHEGMVMAVAFESIVKLIAFLSAGVFVTYGVFSGFNDISTKAMQLPVLMKQFTVQSDGGFATWFWHTFLGMMAILFLPRQFQIAVIENVNENHLRKASWLFPLYLFIITLFVVPIAFGGKLLFGDAINADNYVLAIPLHFNQHALALLVYIGGFSAATSMIIVETIALSIMFSNNVIMPILARNPTFQSKIGQNMGRFVTLTRRFSILLLLLLAYFYHRNLGGAYSLVSIGLISFAAVAQFMPAVIGGIFWKRGNRYGAIIGMILGFLIWFYVLILPSIAHAGIIPLSVVEQGPWGITLLKPLELLGLRGMDSLSLGLFWSLFFNVIGYVIGSLQTEQTSLEHNQAILFVDIFKYSTVIESSTMWRGTAYIPDLRSLLAQFLGEGRAERVLRLFSQRHGIDYKNQQADPRLVNYAEKLLAGIVGTASARVMVSSVAKEERINLDEVVDILKSSQELMAVNKELRRKSMELEEATLQLQNANERLKQLDRLKDDFLSTVTHELRTPLTSIRALSEILYDNPDVEHDEHQHFLGTIIKESERLTKLINQVLDLEKYESGKQSLFITDVEIATVLTDAIESVERLALEKNIHIQPVIDKYIPTIKADFDKLMQVVINLLSNAIKFSPAQGGEVSVSAFYLDNKVIVSVVDNGPGVAPTFHALIFDRFYQAEGQSVRKPKGSGLGLAISKKIIELHNGKIWVESQPNKGAKFVFTVPVLSD
ncbi:MAG: sensor histidine kinase [Spirosomataceae bacterium]